MIANLDSIPHLLSLMQESGVHNSHTHRLTALPLYIAPDTHSSHFNRFVFKTLVWKAHYIQKQANCICNALYNSVVPDRASASIAYHHPHPRELIYRKYVYRIINSSSPLFEAPLLIPHTENRVALASLSNLETCSSPRESSNSVHT